MLKIAITGNIASGKTEFEKLLIDRGYVVIDTDKITHEILAKDSKTIRKIIEQFIEYDILEDSGALSRNKLGELVFSNKEFKYKLESILHPVIRNRIEEYFFQYEKLPIIFVSVPLLFEAGFENLFDKTILIAADEDIRFKRILKRNNWSFDYAKKRLKAQMPQDKKVELSDFVIYNNTSIKNMEFQLNLVLKKLIKF